MNVFVLQQVQTVLKKVPVAAPNQTEPILVNKKKLEYKWGMNVLGELMMMSQHFMLYVLTKFLFLLIDYYVSSPQA